MVTLIYLIKRNFKVFFKDKGMVISAAIAPLILLLLYSTFLGSVFRDMFVSALPEGFDLPKSYINAFVYGWEISSILAICTVTVAFMANSLMIHDKTTKSRLDLVIAPIKNSSLSLSYFISTLCITCVVCLGAAFIGFIIVAISGWFYTAADVFLILLDVIIMSLFGSAISSVVTFFLSSEGTANAVNVIITAAYGFIAGAYSPISQFSSGIKNIIMCLPGTYGTSLFREHFLASPLKALSVNKGVPMEAVNEIRAAFDVDLTFGNTSITLGASYAILLGSIAVCIIAIILLNKFVKPRELRTKKITVK